MTWVNITSVAVLLSVGLAAGCEDVVVGGGGHDADGGSGGVGIGSGGGTTTGATACAGLTPVACAEYCEAIRANPDCAQVTPAYKNDLCGVPLKSPPEGMELQRSSDVQEYAGSGPPELPCCETAPVPGAPATVTMKGIAEIFSHGCESKDLKISVYTVKRTGGEDEAQPDQLVGQAVVTPSSCDASNALASEEEDCGTRYECFYEYPGVPTETELLVVTDGYVASQVKDLWAPVYEYNLYLRNDAVGPDGTFGHDVLAFAQDDYTVAALVSIGGPITPGHGIVMGEVHDCANVRLLNAVVDVEVDKIITTYFADDEAHPLADLSKKATGILGLYAVMDVAPGPVTVAAAGRLDGAIHSVGFFRARVYPDAMTLVTFQGRRPFQGL